MNPTLNILNIQSSARVDDSVSRQLSDEAISALGESQMRINVTERNVAKGTPLIDSAWVKATFTPIDDRDDGDRTALVGSDRLVEELEAADLLVIGLPIYNFGMPAALKAWADQVARAGRTFRYTPDGPEGLLKNKTAWIVVASGGVPVDSPVDFATPHLRQFLRFLGITDIAVIAADRLNADADSAMASARAEIAEQVTAISALSASA